MLRHGLQGEGGKLHTPFSSQCDTLPSLNSNRQIAGRAVSIPLSGLVCFEDSGFGLHARR